MLWLKTAFQQTHEPFDAKHLPEDEGFSLLDFVDPNCIQLQIQNTKKENLFRQATDLLTGRYPAISSIIINSALWEREQLQNTYVGNGVAIPHATLTQAGAGDTAVAIITTAEPIDYGAANKEKSDIFFFTTGSPNGRQTHLKILAATFETVYKSNFSRQSQICPN